MVKKIVLSNVLDYLQKNKPRYVNIFNNNKLFIQASYIIYLQEYIKEYLLHKNNHYKNVMKFEETGENDLFIPINVDKI